MTCCFCSDLHPYHGREAGLQSGTIVGHEFTGVVEAVGEQVGSTGLDSTTVVGSQGTQELSWSGDLSYKGCGLRIH
jgi:threonine dehydrogenase-like Zn-dependent dehydrogenase